MQVIQLSDLSETDKNYLLSKLKDLTDESQTLLPVDYAEKNRVLPPGLTPQPGQWRSDVAPYMNEILNRLSPIDPTKKIVVMKGAQICYTVSVLENAIVYIIGANPGACMFVTASEELAKQVVKLRIEPAIDSCGLRHLIKSQSQKIHGKDTGDTLKTKSFPGGFLISSSLQSSIDGRSQSVQYLLFDEIEAAKEQIGKDGDPLSIFEARTAGYEETKKIFFGSTPLEKQTSKVEPLYLQGDQRKYYIPCPHCGEMQILEWEVLKANIKLDKNKRLISDSCYYSCINCNEKIHNYHKAEFLQSGEWKPTAEAKDTEVVSYHISALYSPVGFLSWESIVRQYLKAKDSYDNSDIGPMKTFVNNVLGNTWNETGTRPEYQLVALHREQRRYIKNMILEDVLFLTLGADIQGDRIECELVGWTEGFKSYSINYFELTGNTEDINDDCYKKLSEIIEAEYFDENENQVDLKMALVDSGYNTPTVYEFCNNYESGVFPIKGESGIKRWKTGCFKKSQIPEAQLYLLSVDYLKDVVYSNLKKGQNEDGSFQNGYCFFPNDYKEKYFRQLCSEEKVVERDRNGHPKFKWVTREGHKRNEQLDCRVYSTAAVNLLAYSVCTEELGYNDIHWSEFWDVCKEMRGF